MGLYTLSLSLSVPSNIAAIINPNTMTKKSPIKKITRPSKHGAFCAVQKIISQNFQVFLLLFMTQSKNFWANEHIVIDYAFHSIVCSSEFISLMLTYLFTSF